MAELSYTDIAPYLSGTRLGDYLEWIEQKTGLSRSNDEKAVLTNIWFELMGLAEKGTFVKGGHGPALSRYIKSANDLSSNAGQQAVGTWIVARILWGAGMMLDDFPAMKPPALLKQALILAFKNRLDESSASRRSARASIQESELFSFTDWLAKR